MFRCARGLPLLSALLSVCWPHPLDDESTTETESTTTTLAPQETTVTPTVTPTFAVTSALLSVVLCLALLFFLLRKLGWSSSAAEEPFRTVPRRPLILRGELVGPCSLSALFTRGTRAKILGEDRLLDSLQDIYVRS